MPKEKILMAMSGGVDSTAAALVLLEQGHDLVGITFRPLYDAGYSAVEDARAVAGRLGFPHHILEIQETFDRCVIRYFVEEYLHGRTPNPCVVCNSLIKWQRVLQAADELGCSRIATGHYARLGFENGRWFIRKGADSLKDQSYFLWKLEQEQLARTLFPLGDYGKDEIRRLVFQAGFGQISKKQESQEICFVPDDDYRSFLRSRIPDYAQRFPAGNFVNPQGEVIGRHEGFPNYTIGQRKGLRVAFGSPRYVCRIDAEKNTVCLGEKEDLLSTEARLTGLHFQKYATLEENRTYITRIRYRNAGKASRIIPEENGCRVRFEEAVSALTPGQSAVIYEGDDLVAGGIIS